jgi:hypothetical protein
MRHGTPQGAELIISDKARGVQSCYPSKTRLAHSGAIGASPFVLLALGHDGGTETRAQVIGQFVELGVAINLNRLLRGVTNHIAVVAPGKVVLQLDFCRFVEHPIQIICQLVQKLRAFH